MGDEGGFAPNIGSNEEGLNLVNQAIEVRNLCYPRPRCTCASSLVGLVNQQDRDRFQNDVEGPLGHVTLQHTGISQTQALSLLCGVAVGIVQSL